MDVPKIEYKLGVTLKLHPDDPKNYDYLRVDVGVSDIDPTEDVAAQMSLALENIEENIAPQIEDAVAAQMKNSGNIAVEGVGLETTVSDLRRDMGKAWTDLAKRLKKVEGKKNDKNNS